MDQRVEVDGHRITLRNLDKVLYPATDTTKGELLHYLTGVADLILPHLRNRPVTRKRWPDGVEAETVFFEKNTPRGAPAWLRRVTLPVPGSTKNRETIDFPFLDDVASLVWAANLAALELHVPQWRVGPDDVARDPDLLVIDLDPGPPAGLEECTEAAFAVRDLLADDGLEPLPVTSGGKGMQLYAAIAGTQGSEVVSGYVHRVAAELEKRLPRLVVSRMTKTLRHGKVFLDWSQNNGAKTTICPFSPRGRELPTVAAPRTWAELEAGGLRQLQFYEVLDRVAELGDPLAHLLPGDDEPGRGPEVPTR
ncbi:non-homologous end-joining DNA ligase [Spongisporangium articulatum]|uniref:Non-homologous end-joining DNA ligase n=1 Tax=Spongisporangium articulatum TaxID=3362603 RepID=A0ABW8AIH7_9ACTN